jgi:hypothetical protein
MVPVPVVAVETRALFPNVGMIYPSEIGRDAYCAPAPSAATATHAGKRTHTAAAAAAAGKTPRTAVAAHVVIRPAASPTVAAIEYVHSV